MHRETFHRLTDEEADAIVRQYDDKALHLGLNGSGTRTATSTTSLVPQGVDRAERPPGETQILQRLRLAGRDLARRRLVRR